MNNFLVYEDEELFTQSLNNLQSFQHFFLLCLGRSNGENYSSKLSSRGDVDERREMKKKLFQAEFPRTESQLESY